MASPRRLSFAALLLPALALVSPAFAKPKESPPDPFAEKTKNAARRQGLLVTWLDVRAGKLFLELPRPAGPRGECGRYL